MNSLIIEVIILVAGFALLLGGGEVLVRGASALASSLGISPLIVGLTVVAFGTSAPELAVNLVAAIKDNGEISFGNIIGSNISNIGLIIGITAIIKPLDIHGSVIRREIPMMLLATLAVLIMGSDFILKNSNVIYDRSDGLLLLLFFSVFLYYTTREVLMGKNADPFIEQVDTVMSSRKLKSIAHDLFFIAAGLVALVAGGKLSVDSAVNIAQSLHVPEVIIGLTIVAVGTSLPELVTSIIATLRGQTDLAVGNIVGSNIFNLLFVMALSSSVRPINVPLSGNADLYVMTFLSFLLFPLAISQRKIVRLEGLLLLVIYITYMAWRIFI